MDSCTAQCAFPRWRAVGACDCHASSYDQHDTCITRDGAVFISGSSTCTRCPKVARHNRYNPSCFSFRNSRSDGPWSSPCCGRNSAAHFYRIRKSFFKPEPERACLRSSPCDLRVYQKSIRRLAPKSMGRSAPFGAVRAQPQRADRFPEKTLSFVSGKKYTLA